MQVVDKIMDVLVYVDSSYLIKKCISIQVDFSTKGALYE